MCPIAKRSSALHRGRAARQSLRASWSEIDEHKRLWTIPAERSKERQTAPDPLVRRSQQYVLQFESLGALARPSQPRRNAAVKLVSKAMARITTTSGVRFRIHDVRRTVATNLSARLVWRSGLRTPSLGTCAARSCVAQQTILLNSRVPQMRTALEAWSRKLQAIIMASPIVPHRLQWSGTAHERAESSNHRYNTSRAATREESATTAAEYISSCQYPQNCHIDPRSSLKAEDWFIELHRRAQDCVAVSV